MKKQLINLIKMRSIITFIFAGITVYAVIAKVGLPEWLVPIITMAFKELFDKDKTKIEKENKE